MSGNPHQSWVSTDECGALSPSGAHECTSAPGHPGPHYANGMQWSGDASRLCLVEGPLAATCEGREGHPGPHGMGDVRWTDADPVPADWFEPIEGTLEVRGFRGLVWERRGPKLVPWSGVCVMDDYGVHVELVGKQHASAVGLAEEGTPAVFVPWRVVHLIVMAEEETTPPPMPNPGKHSG